MNRGTVVEESLSEPTGMTDEGPVEAREVTVVTGAASGIGAAFAHRLAAMGHRLVLVDRDREGLERIAVETRGVSLLCDLAEPGAAEQVAAFVEGRGETVGWLINNAGVARRGRVETVSVASHLETVAVNAAAPVALVTKFLPGMLQRGRGVILNVASSMAFQPVPYLSVYGASKAFLLSFSEALWAECRDRGVRVLCLCPSGTNTAFQDRTGVRRPNDGQGLLAPEQVVEAALRALRGTRCTAVVGLGTRVVLVLKQWLPRTIQARLAAWLMERYR